MSDLVRELAYGLARADTDLAISADAVAIVVRNDASVPPIGPGAASMAGLAGFDAILLDSDGTPTHYCKCRPAGDPDVAHEVAVAQAVMADPALAPHLPRSALAATARLSACVSLYLAGRRYDSLIARQSPAEWAAAVEEIADVTERMAPLVAHALPELVPPGPIALAEEPACAREQLAALELPVKRRDALLRALVAGGTVRAALQHGDLRVSNVLHGDEGWLLPDLGGFGRVRTPLYDLFHLLHTSFAQRRRGDEGMPPLWIEALRDPSEDSTAARAVLRRAVRRHGLGADAALGALACYLADRTARDGATRKGSGPGIRYAAELDGLAGLLRQGASPVAFGLAAA